MQSFRQFLQCRLRAWASRAPIFMALTLFALGIVFWGAFNTALEQTNNERFCVSCHEMRDNVYPAYLASAHHSNASGVSASCPDCHVPHDWLGMVARKISASSELLHHLTGRIATRERFNRQQLQLATKVWNSMSRNRSRECRNCHDRKRMALVDQSKKAAVFHTWANNHHKTCIDCHKGIAHHLPPGYTDAAFENDLDAMHKQFERQKMDCHICHRDMAHADW